MSRARTTHASSTSTKAVRCADDEFQHMVLYMDDILTLAPKDSSLYKD